MWLEYKPLASLTSLFVVSVKYYQKVYNNLQFVVAQLFYFLAKLSPFSIRFISDEYEFVPESMNSPDGFHLAYILREC